MVAVLSGCLGAELCMTKDADPPELQLLLVFGSQKVEVGHGDPFVG